MNLALWPRRKTSYESARVVPELEQTEQSGQIGRNLLERSRGGELFLKEQSLWRQKPAEAYNESRAHSAEAWKQVPARCGPKGLQRYFDETLLRARRGNEASARRADEGLSH
jgi:hypothetical protein